MGLIDRPSAGIRINSIDAADGSSNSSPCTKPVATKVSIPCCGNWLANCVMYLAVPPTLSRAITCKTRIVNVLRRHRQLKQPALPF